MSKYFRNNTFVCLDDITGKKEEMNYVIYNPNKDNIPFRVDLLYRTIKAGLGVELTSEQLGRLTKYESDQLHEFIDELQKILGIWLSGA